MTVLFTAPLTKITEKAIEKLFEDAEIKQMEKEKLRLEIEQLRRAVPDVTPDPSKQMLLRKRVSNFYEQIDKESKVSEVTISPYGLTDSFPVLEKTVSRSHFSKFVLVDDNLPSEVIEHARIDIVAPVLRRGRFKWLGVYEGETIHFAMKSQEFKELVQVGRIGFRNGSSIDCVLEIKRKIGAEGEEKIAGYEVLVVNRYFDDERPLETIEGRKRRNRKNDKTVQGSLFEREKP